MKNQRWAWREVALLVTVPSDLPGTMTGAPSTAALSVKFCVQMESLVPPTAGTNDGSDGLPLVGFQYIRFDVPPSIVIGRKSQKSSVPLGSASLPSGGVRRERNDGTSLASEEGKRSPKARSPMV
jgi:hypothetical protein